ncbi:MAG: STAS domain-containing protein [Treponema sp.]|nr:STAS domain-containing protein [Treponema sp.]
MKNDSLEITEKLEDNILRVTAKGRIDANTSEILQFRLDKALKDGQKNIVLNMAQIEFLSSIGIRVILKTFKQAAADKGSFRIASPSEIVKNVLGMAALSEMLVL